jgi:hypothetical protein
MSDAPYSHSRTHKQRTSRIAVQLKEIVMFALTDIGRNTQRVVCMLLATVVVAVSLSIGAVGAQNAAHNGYSVTITQLQ